MGTGVGKDYIPYITTSEFNSQGTTSVIKDWKTGRGVNMKVSVNVSKKCMIMVSIAVFAMFAICACFLVRWYVSAKNYETTVGKVESISTEITNGPDNQSLSKYYKVEVEYEVDGSNYHATDNYELKPRLKEGQTIKVLYNPQNPQEIKENNQILIFVTALSFLFFVFSIYLTIKAE